jgi:hypothetical protein
MPNPHQTLPVRTTAKATFLKEVSTIAVARVRFWLKNQIWKSFLKKQIFAKYQSQRRENSPSVSRRWRLKRRTFDSNASGFTTSGERS